MQNAYTTVSGLGPATATELGGGLLGGFTLHAGIYKWSSTVTVATDLTLSGSASDVWIF